MVIAICIRIVSGDDAASAMLLRWFDNIAAENTSHQFYFISNQQVPILSAGNIKSIVIKQQSSNPLLWKWWYNYKLPLAVKKIKATLLVSVDGICSLKTALPQCVVINELDFLHHPQWYGRRYIKFIKSAMPLHIQKAAAVITFSESVKNEITSNYTISPGKITVAAIGGNKKYKPKPWNERVKTKDKYTGGAEYFLYSGVIHNRSNLFNLLKAFSLFKKRQKSSMQLVLATDKVPAKDTFVESLRLYKYRNEVKLLEALTEEEMMALTASATCVVNLSPLYSDINYLLNALLCEVPVIAGNTALANEVLKDAALYAVPSVIDSIAESLMIMYKDEKRHEELVGNGKRLQKVNKWGEAWETIVSMAGAG